jgi:hypothetical protein
MSLLKKNKIYFDNAPWVADELKKEIDGGLAILKAVDKPLITYLGSHIAKKDEYYYKHAEKLAQDLGKIGYGAVTGGQNGVVYAANEGAKKSGMPSIGFKAGLLAKDNPVNELVFTESYSFYFVFARRFLLSIKSEALIFYPGGYGTLSELFEYVKLMQSGIVDTVPIICIGREYWADLIGWLKKKVLAEGYLVRGEKDIELIYVVDTVEEVLKIVGHK